jgi:hypothetical protein
MDGIQPGRIGSSAFMRFSKISCDFPRARTTGTGIVATRQDSVRYENLAKLATDALRL